MNEELRNKLRVKENEPNDWFETLYFKSNDSGSGIPWANMAPHPIFKKWIDQISLLEYAISLQRSEYQLAFKQINQIGVVS